MFGASDPALLPGYALVGRGRFPTPPPPTSVLNALQAIRLDLLERLKSQDDIKAMCIVHQCITKDGLAKEKAQPSRRDWLRDDGPRHLKETSFALPWITLPVDLTPRVWGVNIRSLGNNFSPLVFPIFLFRRVSFC